MKTEPWKQYFDDFRTRADRIPADAFDRGRLLYEAAHDTYQSTTDRLTESGLDGIWAVLLGAVVGVVVAAGLVMLLRTLSRQQGNSQVSRESYAGLTAVVTLSIPPGGKGEVQFRDKNGVLVLSLRLWSEWRRLRRLCDEADPVTLEWQRRFEQLAARLDVHMRVRLRQGAGIVTPMLVGVLRPTILFLVVITTIGYLQLFEEPFVMTEGGPLDQTLSISMYMYQQGFEFFKQGYAAAIAWILFILVAIVAVVQIRVLRSEA
jgi:hypothetical protein